MNKIVNPRALQIRSFAKVAQYCALRNVTVYLNVMAVKTRQTVQLARTNATESVFRLLRFAITAKIVPTDPTNPNAGSVISPKISGVTPVNVYYFR